MDKLIDFVIQRISKVTANVYDSKSKTMVSTRLKRRMLELDMSSPEEYLKFLEVHYNEEEPLLVELLTTHHTFLFREIIHFEYLKENLDQIIQNVKSQGRSKIRLWSAAASTGQEAYSLALFLDQELKKRHTSLSFEILGTDVAPQSIETAKAGIYPYDKIKEIPAHYFSGYWNRIRSNGTDSAQISPLIRDICHFQTHNLLEPLSHQEPFDIIFCRNVFIYFNEENIKSSLKNLMQKLAPNGLLFTGVSEPVGSYTMEIDKVGPCIYTRRNEQKNQTIHIPSSESKIYNIVTVDDSPAVLKVLKKIFDEDSRYNLIKQCKDGEELHSYLKTHPNVDLITLDLHMPNLDGVSYLERHYNQDHPPVLIVSSVNRDNQDLGRKAIKLGAIDYVEKPNFKNFSECSEELKNKIITFLSLNDKKETIPTLEPVKARSEVVITPSVNKKLTPVSLYLFAQSHSKERVLLLIREIYEKGFIPKHIITSQNEDIDLFKSEIKEFYKSKGQFITSIEFSRSLDFFVNYKHQLQTEDRPIFCIYQGVDAYSYLQDFIPFDSYILSEKAILHSKHHIDAMPSTSWGFHVTDFLDHDKFNQDTVYKWKDFQGKTLELKFGHALVVFYEHPNIPHSFLEVKNLNHAQDMIIGFLKKYSSIRNYKIAAPLSIGKRVKSLLDQQGLSALNLFKSSGDALYNLKGNLLRIKEKNKKVTTSSPTISSQTSSIKSPKKIKVCVIDDSVTLTKVLKKHIESDSSIECISIHHDTKRIEHDLLINKPDVITLDMNMPGIDGDEIYERFIKKYHIPTILLTSSDKSSKKVLKALNLGVLDYIQKPALSELNSHSFPLIQRIKEASVAKVRITEFSPVQRRISSSVQMNNALILIGSSTGGTRALSYLLSHFPTQFPPVVIGQHIPAGYSKDFADLLNEKNPFSVKEASSGEEVLPNTVYIAPGGRHLSLRQDGNKIFFRIKDEVIGARFTPSIDHLFDSALHLKHYQIVAAILTGMGKDGSQSLKNLKDRGHHTLTQDEKSSVVYGMPKAAFEIGAACKQVSLSNMSFEIFEGIRSFKAKKAS